MRSVIAVVTVLSLSTAAFLHAESLGEVAAREKEKRKGKKDGKVITEEELLRAKGSGLSMNDGSSPASAPASAPAKEGEAKDKDGKPVAAGEKGKEAPKEKTEEELKTERQKDWRTRLDKANADVAAAQKVVSEWEATPGLFNNASATAQLAEARKRLTEQQSQVTALDEEGRRNGFR
jgi:hypothetical protein